MPNNPKSNLSDLFNNKTPEEWASLLTDEKDNKNLSQEETKQLDQLKIAIGFAAMILDSEKEIGLVDKEEEEEIVGFGLAVFLTHQLFERHLSGIDISPDKWDAAVRTIADEINNREKIIKKLKFVLQSIREPLCNAICPTVWETDEGRKHHALCLLVNSVLD